MWSFWDCGFVKDSVGGFCIMGFVGLGIRFEFGEVGGFDVGGLVVMNFVFWVWGIFEVWEVVCNWVKCILM